jgi:hypothetical protein
MSGFEVGVAALGGPAQRFKKIGTDLSMAASGGATAAGQAGAAAGAPAVASAVEVFKTGMQTVLSTLGQDAGLLGDKVQKAGVTYEAVDRTAMPESGSGKDGGTRDSGSGDGKGGDDGNGDSNGKGPPPAPRHVDVRDGEGLWTTVERYLGPGATNEQIRTETRRWYAANRDVMGPTIDDVRVGTRLRVPDKAPTGG